MLFSDFISSLSVSTVGSSYSIIFHQISMFMTSFVSTEDDLDKSWKTRLSAHRFELLIASCLIVVVILALGIGLGGKELGAVSSI